MNKRIYLIDNVRAILIFLVVFGHFIEPLILNSNMFLILYGVIYAFHMPLFAMVSGYFSKIPTKKEIVSLLKIFFVFEIIYGLTSALMLFFFAENMKVFFGSASSGGLLEVLTNVFSPIWLLWYLLALIFWKLFLHLFGKNKYSILLAIIIALVIGFVGFNGRFLTYQRMFGMFPFFLIGYYANYDMVLNLKKSRYSFLVVIMSIVLSILVVPKIININVELLYYADGFQQFDISILSFIMFRILMFITSLMLCISIVYMTPNKKLFFSKLGANTIGIYLGHGLIFLLLMGVGLFNYASSLNDIVVIVMMLFLSYFVTLFLNQKFIIKFINKITFNERK